MVTAPDRGNAEARAGSLLLVALLVFSMASCDQRSAPAVELRVSEDRGALRISIRNRTNDEIHVPANFLDRLPHPLSLRIFASTGEAIHMCDGIDYVHGSDVRRIPSGGTEEIAVPLSAVKIAYCLNPGGNYRASATVEYGGAAMSVADSNSIDLLIE